MKKVFVVLAVMTLSLSIEVNAQSFLWARTADYVNSPVTGFAGYGIAADPSNNIVVTGQFVDTAYFDLIPLLAGKDFHYQGFVAKYNAAGNALWAKRFGGKGMLGNIGRSVATDKNGNIYVTGEIENISGRTITFDTVRISNTPSGTAFGSSIFNSFSGVVLAKLRPNGDVEWAKMLNDSTGSGCGYGVCIDSNGNCLVCGSFRGKIRFGADSIYYPGLTGFLYSNSFAAKLDPSGNILWAKQGKSVSETDAYAIAIDQSDNFYVTGYFGSTSSKSDTINFGSVSLTGKGLFVTKHDKSGNALWAHGSAESPYEQGNAIAVDKSGNVFVSGEYGALATTIFVAKFDAAGNPVWSYDAGGTQANESYGMTVDDNNDIYFIGSIKGSGVFNSKAGKTWFTGMGACDIYLAKYGNDGSLKWVEPAGATSGFGDFGYGVAIDHSNNIVLTGNVSTKSAGNSIGNYDMNPGGRFGNIIVHSQGLDAIFVAKLDPNAKIETHVWSSVNSGLPLDNPIYSQPIINSIYSTGSALFLASDVVSSSAALGSIGLGGAYRSTNEGYSWEIINNGLSLGDHINGFVSLNGNLLAAGNRGIYSSRNNGDSWSQTNMSNPAASFTLSGSNIYACGGNKIYLSKDNGTSWNTVSSTGLSSGVSSTVISSSGTNLFINNTGTSTSDSLFAGIYRSTDNGITWKTSNSGLPFTPSYRQKIYPTIVSFSNIGNDIFIATDSNDVHDGLVGMTGVIFKSTDEGATWVPRNKGLPLKADGNYAALFSLITTGNILIAGTSEGIYSSTDNGENWQDFSADLPTKTFVTAMAADNQFITAGTSENVWRRSISSTTAVNEKANDIVPAMFTLSQNYPNPFNPSTTISFQVPFASKVSLKVYDILGRGVAELVNEFKPAGKFTITFSANSLASGIYFYNLQAGNHFESKKMIVLK